MKTNNFISSIYSSSSAAAAVALAFAAGFALAGCVEGSAQPNNTEPQHAGSASPLHAVESPQPNTPDPRSSSSASPARAVASSPLSAELKNQKVSVAVFVQGGDAAFERTVQSRLESIMSDNSITTLDQSKADELKTNWPNLIHTDYVITADDWLKFAKQYEIKAIARIYLSADSSPGLADYFSATAHADVRVVMDDARVLSATSFSMGVPGNPPSDGLTKDSAMRNAVERAVDDACGKLGLQILDPAKQRSVKLRLVGPVAAPGGVSMPKPGVADNAAKAMAKLENATWRNEEITSSAKSPDGGFAALGGYITDTDFHRSPQRLYGAKVHVVDLKAGREVKSFWCYEVEKKEKREKGDRQVYDCLFVSNWRYLSAVTGSDLFLWDTELGDVISRVSFDNAFKGGNLSCVRADTGCYLIAGGSAYRIERAKD